MVDLILMHLVIHGAMKKDRLLDLVPGSDEVLSDLLRQKVVVASGKRVLISPRWVFVSLTDL